MACLSDYISQLVEYVPYVKSWSERRLVVSGLSLAHSQVGDEPSTRA